MDQQQQSRWRRPTGTQVTWIGIGVVAGLFAAIVVFGGYYFEWKWTGFPKRTPWDWVDLLIVPVVLALGGYLFTRAENRRAQTIAERQWRVDQQIAEQRRALDVQLTNERTAVDREVAENRWQEDVMQAYLDRIGQMLLDKDKPLLQSEKGDESRMLVRGHTVMTLRRLNGERNASLLRFLFDAGLLDPEDPIICLEGAMLRKTELAGAPLLGQNLSRANLVGADLRMAFLERANLERSALALADLSNADLTGAVLRRANLADANLTGADLTDVDLSGAFELTSKFSQPLLPNEVLEQQAKSLKGATMPDGQKYEDWLKSKGREEDGENSGAS